MGHEYELADFIRKHQDKVEITDTCYLWRGGCNNRGYGMVWVNNDRQMRLVHRVVYEAVVGSIPDGYELDHVRDWGCTNNNCFRPDHLEPVTSEENIRRQRQWQTLSEFCGFGHQFTSENTYIRPDNGGRSCKACHCERVQIRKEEKTYVA